MTGGIIEVDLHGLNCEEANKRVARELERAPGSVYRLRIIHGYHGGTGISRMLREEYGYGRDHRVKRIEGGWNPGITELVLREL